MTARTVKRTARDRAPHTALQDRLACHELELRIVLDHMHEHVVYLDPTLRVRWANHAARAAARHPDAPDACEGHTCHMVWQQSATPCTDCPVVRCLHSQQPEAGELCTPCGHWWAIKAHPVFDQTHTLTGIIQLSHEITKRVRTQEELRRQLRHQQLIAALAARLVPSAALDDLVTPTLADIGAALAVERVCVWRISQDDLTVNCVWQWHAPDKPALAGPLDDVCRANYHWSQAQTTTHGYMAVHDTDKLPPEAAPEKAFFDRFGMRAIVLIPLYAHGVTDGYLTCDCTSASRTWHDAEIALLRTCAEIMMNAFERTAAEQHVRHYQQQLEVIVDERTAKLQRANDQLTNEIMTRIQAQDALLHTQADLAQAQVNAAIGSWSYDPATGTMTWSDEMYHITGIPLGAPVPSFPDGHRVFLCPDEYDAMVEAVARAVGQGTPYEIELAIRRSNGEVRFVIARGTPVCNAENAVIRLVGTLQDVTERHVLELRRQQMVTRLQAVLRCAQELLTYESLNDVCRRGVELAREQLGIERCALFLRSESGVRGTYGTNRRGETVDEHTLSFSYHAWQETVRRLSGATRWYLDENHALMEFDGSASTEIGRGWVVGTPMIVGVDHIVGVMFNDTALSGTPVDHDLQELFAVYCSLLSACIQRAITLNELRTSEERTRVLFEYAPVALAESDSTRIKVILDRLRAEGVRDIADWLLHHPECVTECACGLIMRRCNRYFLDLFAASSKEEMSQRILEVFTPQALDAFCKQLDDFARGTRFASNATLVRTLRGNDRHVVINWLIMPGYETTFERTFISVVDTTDTHAHLQQIESYQEQLRVMAAELTLTEERERRRLAAALHDDVCQMLAMVKMQLDLLMRDPLRNRTNARVETTSTLVTHAIQSARSLMFDLSPPMLHEIGLGASLEWLAEKLMRDHTLTVGIRVRTDNRPLPWTKSPARFCFWSFASCC